MYMYMYVYTMNTFVSLSFNTAVGYGHCKQEFGANTQNEWYSMHSHVCRTEVIVFRSHVYVPHTT